LLQRTGHPAQNPSNRLNWPLRWLNTENSFGALAESGRATEQSIDNGVGKTQTCRHAISRLLPCSVRYAFVSEPSAGDSYVRDYAGRKLDQVQGQSVGGYTGHFGPVGRRSNIYVSRRDHRASGRQDSGCDGGYRKRVDQNPLITFKSTRTVQSGPNTFEVDGDFTIRGVTEPEKLTLVVSGKGTGSGEINGTMAFDRKDYGMNSGIPFIRIADRVEVTVALKAKRVSGPPLVFNHLPA
jgi:YceI-like protein